MPVSTPHPPSTASVAIVGAGASGLLAGRRLQEAGFQVQIFEKSRGPSGRLSTRRQAGYAFDHGAQYFTVKDNRFRPIVDEWIEAGVVAPWGGSIAVLKQGDVTPKDSGPGRYVGVPRMSSLGRHLEPGLDIVYKTRVGSAEQTENGWALVSDAGDDLGTFETLLITAPPEQTLPFVESVPALHEQVAGVDMLPCWAVMAAFDTPLPLNVDGAFVHDSPLSWVARNTSKPGRPEPETWVLHASPEWSTAHLEEEKDAVAPQLLEAFFEAAGITPVEPAFATAHRWRYAQVGNPLNEGCLWDQATRLGVAGDWCNGSRVEGAFMSGLLLAEKLIGSRIPSS